MTKNKVVHLSLALILPLVAAVLFLTVPWQGLDIQALDLKQRLHFASPKDSLFLFQTLPPRQKHQTTLHAMQPLILRAIEQLSQQNAKAIVLLLDNQFWQEPARPEELSAFRDILVANPRVYLYAERKGSYLPLLKEFRNFPRLFSFTDKCYDGPGMIPEDHKTRRLMLRYKESGEITSPLHFLKDLGMTVSDQAYARTFDLMGTDQYYLKFYASDGFRLNSATADLSDHVVFLGYQDIFSGTMSLAPVASNEIEQTATPINAREMFEGEYLAQLFYGLNRGEHIRETPAAVSLVFFLFFVLLLTVFTMRIDEAKMPLKTAVVLLSGNTLPFFLLFEFDIHFPSIPIAFASILVPYITIPTALYRLQKEKSLLTKKMQELRFEGHIAARSAEANATFRLATRVAHDIRGPLSALQTVGSNLKTNPNTLDQRRFALYQRALARLEDVASSLLLLYKTSGRFGKSQMGLYPLKQLEQALRQHLADVAPEITFRFSNHCQCEYISVARVELERHLFNLINNSIEALRSAMTPTPRIEITTERDGHFIHIVILDNGPGIPTEHQNRLFHDGGTFGKKAGNGLALAAARKFSRNLSGDMVLLPSAEGACFKMSFLAFQPSFDIKIDQKSHLLVIDDDSDVLDSIQSQMRSLQTELPTEHCHFTPDPHLGREILRRLRAEGGRVTVISDLVFENSDLLGFDILAENAGPNFLYSSLAGEDKIRSICDKAGYHLVAKDLVIRIQTEG